MHRDQRWRKLAGVDTPANNECEAMGKERDLPVDKAGRASKHKRGGKDGDAY